MDEKVMLIFNDDGSEEHVVDGKVVEIDGLLERTNEVAAALRSRGYPTRVVPLKAEKPETLDDLVREIKDAGQGIVFNLCEGAFGSSYYEMHVAAILEIHDAWFTGSGPLTLGLALDKGLTKDILAARGIPTAGYSVMDDPDDVLKDGLGFPLIVKPLKEDASIGIDSGAVVYDAEGLKARVAYIVETYDQSAIVEEYIDGREFNISVLGNAEEARALPPSEIAFVDFPEGVPRICGYEAKWDEQSPLYKKTVPVCPADVDPEFGVRLAELALKAYEVMGCRDYARVDMRLGPDGGLRVLEVNPNPDISSDAGLARAARAAGFDYAGLLVEIVKAAQSRYAWDEEDEADDDEEAASEAGSLQDEGDAAGAGAAGTNADVEA